MTTEPPSILSSGPSAGVLESRLADGADRLAAGARPSLLGHPRLLIGAAAALMTFGVSVVVLGWIGASHSTYVEEQVPYLISGGLLGVALSTIGALLFFTHWLTVSIKEARSREAARRLDHEQLMDALRSLNESIARQGDGNGNAGSAQPGRPLRRAPRGS